MGCQGRRERGSELIEFALVASALIPILFGTIVVGLNISRGIQVAQVSRDVGHMYARTVDFSDASNQNIAVRLAEGLHITTTGGNGNIILSKVTFIAQSDCQAAGLSTGACTNMNYCVFTNRIVIGNKTIKTSPFGTPSSTIVDAEGNIVTSNYLKDTSARATGFSSVLPLQSGQFAYVSEVYVQSSDYGLPGYQSTGAYSRTIF